MNSAVNRNMAIAANRELLDSLQITKLIESFAVDQLWETASILNVITPPLDQIAQEDLLPYREQVLSCVLEAFQDATNSLDIPQFTNLVNRVIATPRGSTQYVTNQSASQGSFRNQSYSQNNQATRTPIDGSNGLARYDSDEATASLDSSPANSVHNAHPPEENDLLQDPTFLHLKRLSQRLGEMNQQMQQQPRAEDFSQTDDETSSEVTRKSVRFNPDLEVFNYSEPSDQTPQSFTSTSSTKGANLDATKGARSDLIQVEIVLDDPQAFKQRNKMSGIVTRVVKNFNVVRRIKSLSSQSRSPSTRRNIRQQSHAQSDDETEFDEYKNQHESHPQPLVGTDGKAVHKTDGNVRRQTDQADVHSDQKSNAKYNTQSSVSEEMANFYLQDSHQEQDYLQDPQQDQQGIDMDNAGSPKSSHHSNGLRIDVVSPTERSSAQRSSSSPSSTGSQSPHNIQNAQETSQDTTTQPGTSRVPILSRLGCCFWPSEGGNNPSFVPNNKQAETRERHHNTMARSGHPSSEAQAAKSKQRKQDSPHFQQHNQDSPRFQQNNQDSPYFQPNNQESSQPKHSDVPTNGSEGADDEATFKSNSSSSEQHWYTLEEEHHSDINTGYESRSGGPRSGNTSSQAGCFIM